MEFVAVKEEEPDLYEREDEEMPLNDFNGTEDEEIPFNGTVDDNMMPDDSSNTMLSLPLVPKIEMEELDEGLQEEHEENLPFLSNHFMAINDNNSLDEQLPTRKNSKQDKNITIPTSTKIQSTPVSRCFHCLKYFSNDGLVLEHCKIQHYCKYCNILFKNYDEFYLHNFNIHTDNDSCELCSVEFNSLQSRYMHTGSHTYVQGYDYQGKDKYVPSTNISDPYSLPAINETYNCSLCTSDITDEDVHLCTKLICIICNLKYEYVEMLMNHIKEKHLKNDNSSCIHCNKTGLKKIDYVSHLHECKGLRKERNENNINMKSKNKINCKYCNGGYTKLKISKHIIQNHRCLLCKKILPNSILLARHIIRIHKANLDIIECQICTARSKFANRKKLNIHLKKNHIPGYNRINCRRCGESIYNTYIYRRKHYNVCPSIVASIADEETLSAKE